MGDKASPLILFVDKAYAVGGAQTFIRMLREIVHHYSVETGASAHFLSLLDADEDTSRHERPVSGTTFRGFAGSRSGFVFAALRLARRHPGAHVVVGHLGLARLAWVLKRLSLIDGYLIVIYGVEAWVRRGWIDRLSIDGAAKIISLSRYTAEEFSSANGCDRSKIEVIVPAVEIPKDSEPPSVPDRTIFNVLSVGRFRSVERLKGADEVLAAFRVFHGQHPSSRLTMVGTGDDLPRLIAHASDIGLERSIRFIGIVPDKDLSALYSGCDTLIMLSRKEGLGLVFLEAMAFGKPCVGAAAGGTSEAIEDGVDGFLVDPLDAVSAGNRLKRLADDSELRTRMGKAGRRKVLEIHSFNRMERSWHRTLARVQRAAGRSNI